MSSQNFKLVVVTPFRNYQRGDIIADAASVEEYMFSQHVRRTKARGKSKNAEDDKKPETEKQAIESAVPDATYHGNKDEKTVTLESVIPDRKDKGKK